MADLFWERVWSAVSEHPWRIVGIPRWLTQRAVPDGAVEVETLPFDEAVLAHIREQRAANRTMFLVSDEPLAVDVASHLGFFDGTITPEECAANGYEPIDSALSTRPSRFAAFLRQLRIHQWVKNLLVFGALVLSHNWSVTSKVEACMQAFVAFDLVASSVYVFNDLLDLHADRRHPFKRKRPLAAGALPLWSAALLSPLLAIAGLWVGALLSTQFIEILAIYFVTAFFYSTYAKRKVILDVMLLSGLYSIRLYAGGAAADIPISTWTAAYTSFLFFSLALMKRYAEVIAEPSISNRRGYERGDASIIAALGCASGLIAALPLALYAGSPEVRALYRSPSMLWPLCGVHVYWVSRIWILAHRGLVVNDPVWFAVRDPATYYLAICSAIVLYLAT